MKINITLNNINNLNKIKSYINYFFKIVDIKIN